MHVYAVCSVRLNCSCLGVFFTFHLRIILYLSHFKFVQKCKSDVVFVCNYTSTLFCSLLLMFDIFFSVQDDGKDGVPVMDTVSSSGFAPNYNPAMRLSSSYPTAETFAYAQYAHDTYLMAAKSRPTPYSRPVEYTSGYRPSNIKMPYGQSSGGFGYAFDAR